MNKFTKEMVDSYADKLLIGLTPEENKMVLDEFEEIDKGIDLINDIEGIKNIEPMTHALDDTECILREDIAEDGMPIENVLQNAGGIEGREIEVPKVVYNNNE